MDELSRKFRSIDWKGLQKSARKMQASTASALKDMVMTDLENKTRAATADTTWGASGADMMAIAHGTFRREDYALIMSIVWQRLASSRWRCVFKALDLLKFLIMHGSSRCAEESRAATPHLRALTEYVASDDSGRDVGEGVRRRAALVCEMLENADVMEAERMRSKELRSKLQGGGDAPGVRVGGGLSSDDYRFGASASGMRTYGGADYDSETHRAGRYGEHGEGGAARGRVQTTATFKGYGDDVEEEEGGAAYNGEYHAGGAGSSSGTGGGGRFGGEQRYGGYDEEPKGHFAQRAKTQAAVDDLLGDDEDAGKNENSGIEDGLDLNAQSGAVVAVSGDGAPATAGVEDLLAELSNVSVRTGDGSSAAASTSGAAAKPMSTSQLVQQLAAQREQSLMQVAVVGTGQEAASSHSAASISGGIGMGGNSGMMTMPGSGVAHSPTGLAGGASGSDDWFANSGESPAKTSGDGEKKKVLTRKADNDDPFADLLDTGKKSGVV